MNKKITIYLFAVIFMLISVVTVSEAALAGKATVSWEPVTTNQDGSAITDLAGYKIYYGTAQRAPGVNGDCPTDAHGYTDIATIDNKDASSYELTNLIYGHEYFFSVTAFDTATPANESCFSDEKDKIFPVVDVNNDEKVNIKDIQSCISVITGGGAIDEIVQLCKIAAAPIEYVNIKDIQAIIGAILGK